MNRLYRLLSFGYLPKELPPIFTSRPFAKLTYRHPDLGRVVGNTWQRSTPFLLQQTPHYRRRLDILCPQACLGIARQIADNYGDLQQYFTDLPGNCSRPAFNRETKYQRAVRPYSIGQGYVRRKLQLRSRFPVVLKLDVKDCYRSIYTHAIPWALYGKEYAKTHLREDNFGNNLDKAVRNGQDGQTTGIPTGPDTSFIIAELIFCRLFDKMLEDGSIEDHFVRYYDDIEYGCESEDEGHRVLAIFERELREFELEINPNKVELLSGPYGAAKPWVYRLHGIKWTDGVKAQDLTDFFSYLAEIAKAHPNDHVFRYFLRTMRTVIVDEGAWDVFQSILLGLFQQNRGNAREVFDQLRYYQQIGWQIDKAALKLALDQKVRGQLGRCVTSELSWALYGYLLFDIPFGRELAERVLDFGDAPS